MLVAGRIEQPAEFDHQPVLIEEVVTALSPSADTTCLDVTLGLGGHASALCAQMPNGVYLGIDCDAQALARARERLADAPTPCILRQGRFADAKRLVLEQVGAVDMVLADLGVSSLQLDDPVRGLGFRHSDAPLDLRLDGQQGQPASRWLVDADPQDVAAVLRLYGDVGIARRVARALIEAQPRTMGALQTTLAPLQRRERRDKLVPRVVQALRIWVNDEMRDLSRLLADLPAICRPGARVVVISYHSVEDRLVKQAFRSWARGCICPPRQPVCTCGRAPLGRMRPRRVIMPGDEELRANPRARSARMRVFEFARGAA